MTLVPKPRRSKRRPAKPALGTAQQLGAYAFAHLPDFLQLDLARDSRLREALDLKLGGSITLYGGPSFDREAFFDAVRATYAAGGGEIGLSDEVGAAWTMTADPADQWSLRIVDGSRTFRLHDVFALHPDQAVRLAGFALALNRAGLEEADFPDLAGVIHAGPLSNDTLREFEESLALTPLSFAARMESSVDQGELSLSDFVPDQRIYFERLIGASQDLRSLAELVLGVHRHIDRIFSIDPGEAPKLALLLSAHHQLLAGSALSEVPEATLVALCRWAASAGDLVAATSLIELAFERPTLSAPLAAAIATLIPILVETETGPGSAFHVLSGVIVLTAGELARTQILADWAPTARRAAVFAHSALIMRQTTGRLANPKQFADWCFEHRGNLFLMQALADLRLEPRWLPAYAEPAQLKQELLSRVLQAASNSKAQVESQPALQEIIFGDGSNSLKSAAQFPMLNWPGPLEGGDDYGVTSPPDPFLSILKESLEGEELGEKNIIPLINLYPLFKIDTGMLDHAAKQLEKLGYRLIEGQSLAEARPLLNGLAGAAAAQRYPRFADQVRRLLIRRRRDGAVPEKLSLIEEFNIMLTAAAAHRDPDAWNDFLTDWMFDLAMRASPEEGQSLRAMIETFCGLEPELWHAAGHALAAIVPAPA